jgi:hypothetical protein
MSNQGFTAVLPDPDDEFQEDQTPRIVLGCEECLIKGLVINDDGKGGVFTALKLNPLKNIPLKPWKLLPDNQFIEIKDQNGFSDSECRFVFLD